MHLSTQAHDTFWLVKVEAPRIDAEAALDFKEAMLRETKEAQEAVLLDLSAVEFIDSSGLGALVGTMKALAPERALHLAGAQPPVMRVFELTRMDTVFPLHDSVAKALEPRDA